VITTLVPQILVLMADGQVIPTAGIWVTVTLKEQVETLPQQSVAEQLTGVVPSGNENPEGGLHPIVTLVQQASEAVGE
jgi:hypothetical protein